MRLVVCGREALAKAPEYAGAYAIRRYIIEDTRAADIVTKAEQLAYFISTVAECPPTSVSMATARMDVNGCEWICI